jgi:hypothetical protein
MYDPVPSDMTLAALVVSLVLALAGFVWVRRIATVEGDPRSFRATAPRVRDYLPAIAVVVLVGLLSAVAYLIWRGSVGGAVFGTEVTLLGRPATVVTSCAGLAGCAIGALWMWRIATRDEMDPREWGAAAPPSVSPLHFVAGLAVTALLGTTIALALG